MATLPRLIVTALAGVLMLAACAAPPVAPGAGTPAVTVSESSDLADAVRRARELAVELGPERVLLAFDIDNTMLASQTGLGSDAWYEWQKELAAADPCDARLVGDTLAVQGALYHEGSMRLTQQDLPALLSGARAAAHPMMVITARGGDFRLATFRELRRNGLDFRDSSPGPAGGFVQDLELAGAVRPVRYEDGVLMLAGQNKGRMLLALYDHLGLKPPAAVVFADDKAKNIADMAAALAAAGVRAELYRYGREDARVDAFRPGQAAHDWARLGPALRELQAIMGGANFRLPATEINPACVAP